MVISPTFRNHTHACASRKISVRLNPLILACITPLIAVCLFLSTTQYRVQGAWNIDSRKILSTSGYLLVRCPKILKWNETDTTKMSELSLVFPAKNIVLRLGMLSLTSSPICNCFRAATTNTCILSISMLQAEVTKTPWIICLSRCRRVKFGSERRIILELRNALLGHLSKTVKLAIQRVCINVLTRAHANPFIRIVCA